MHTAQAPRESTDQRPRPGEARRAASRVIGAWAADCCPGASDEELERLAREVVRAVRRAVTPRVVPPGHPGLTSKPGADAEAARRIAARLEAELRPTPPPPYQSAARAAAPAPAAAPLRRPLLQPRPYR
ncbi:hypothetical protein [Peterkaempfera bronchialis]|uniref:hypothetical protein n=1 Tax=Peterkaempfera bronchialis TaxID=2126346 RepID=UPI0013B44177|nr:hypothetical protein [Peterkaempfera bronchialis]